MSNVIEISAGFAPPSSEAGDYSCAQSATRRLVEQLVETPELDHLRGARIRVIFHDKQTVTNGKRILGRASKFSEKDRLLHGWQFLIVLDKDWWNKHPSKQEALMFHELLHCWIEPTGKTSIRPHDLEEFGAVVERYGLWKKDVETFKAQMDLFAKDGGKAVKAQ